MVRWTTAALTDQGAKRSDNQDNFLVTSDNRVFVVADGMGGAVGGATAARLTIEAIQLCWDEMPPKLDDPESVTDWISEAIDRANEAVIAEARRDPAVQGMGTTVVLAVQSDNGLYLAHVGDSRAYRVRNGSAELLTTDHSLVMELFRSGHITEEQMKESPFKHYITRCIGHKRKVDVDHQAGDIEPGDWVVLCTDGLTTVLQDDTIAEVLASEDDPSQACHRLVQLTLDGGAPDNVTVILIKYEKETVGKADLECGSQDSAVR